jgi:hypothetical protein
MTEATSRTEQFKSQIDDMKLKTGWSNWEAALRVFSVVLMVVGAAVAFGAYEASLNVKATPGSNVDLLRSNSYLPLAVWGLTISVVGGFLFLRYSLAQFLRFWLLRQSYEQQVAIGEAAKARLE